jgi:hypothetical protein
LASSRNQPTPTTAKPGQCEPPGAGMSPAGSSR